MTENSFSGQRVLLVDDDEAIRALVQKILQRQDLTVTTARDGQEAIEKLREGDYDVILLDLMMPRVDGFGVMQHLREKDPEALKRVIVMTAFTAAARERIEPNCRLIAKPFDIVELIGVIRSCIDARPSGTAQ